MSVVAAREQLAGLAGRWARRRIAAVALVVVAASLPALAAADRIGAAPALVLGLLVAATAGGWVLRSVPVGVRALARHLDRTTPELEESTELVLVDTGELGALGRLQQARVADRIGGLPDVRLPLGPLAKALRAAAGMLLLAGAVWVLPHDGDNAASGGAIETAVRVAPPVLSAIDIVVEPPAYTALPARSAAWDLDAEDGARITCGSRHPLPIECGSRPSMPTRLPPCRRMAAGRCRSPRGRPPSIASSRKGRAVGPYRRCTGSACAPTRHPRWCS